MAQSSCSSTFRPRYRPQGLRPSRGRSLDRLEGGWIRVELRHRSELGATAYTQKGDKMRKTIFGVTLLVLVLVSLAAMALAIGCGSGSGSTTSASSSASAATGADIAYCDSLIAKYRQVPVFKAPGPAFDAKGTMAGKTILTIPVTSANPYTEGIIAQMKQIADKVGFTLKVYPNQGQPSQWVQGVEQGITEGVDAIDLLGGTDPRSLKPQIDAAHKAGIKVFASSITALNQSIPYVDASFGFDYNLAGQVLAAWTISKMQGDGNVLILVSNEAFCQQPYTDGMTSTFDKYGGPNIKYKVQNVSIPDWTSKITPIVQSAIVADPKLKYVLASYDAMTQYIVPAIETAGASGTVKTVGLNGQPFVLDMVRAGKVDMDIGENLVWIAAGILDGEMRGLGNVEPVTGSTKEFSMNVPLYIFDQSNAADAGVPAEYSKGYGADFMPEYYKLWGLQ